nr:iron-sulfur cluster assembly 1 homolog, mitochondrial [Delphinus delphis]
MPPFLMFSHLLPLLHFSPTRISNSSLDLPFTRLPVYALGIVLAAQCLGLRNGAVRRSLWRQCARRVHGERLRWPSSGPRYRGAGRARMSASLVRATVRAVSKRKLQPTRAALTLTPSAVNKIKQLLKDKPEHVGVKVGVRTRGCNGLSYTLEYTKTKGDSDEEVVQDGVRVFIEKKAQLTLLGTEMDYVEDKLSSEFVFNNPNIKGTCGCGESFNI